MDNSLISHRMASVNLVVTVESVRTLLTHKGGDTNALHIPSLIAVAAALGESFPSILHACMLTTPQVSNYFSFFIVLDCASLQAKYECSGKIIEMTYG